MQQQLPGQRDVLGVHGYANPLGGRSLHHGKAERQVDAFAIGGRF
jgi:hypothetical protein